MRPIKFRGKCIVEGVQGMVNLYKDDYTVHVDKSMSDDYTMYCLYDCVEGIISITTSLEKIKTTSIT